MLFNVLLNSLSEDYTHQDDRTLLSYITHQAPVVQRLDSAIHWINHLSHWITQLFLLAFTHVHVHVSAG